MKKTISFCSCFKISYAILFGLLLSLLAFFGCASRKPQPSASQYRFSFNDEAYRIRSVYSEDKAESYNELIGVKFLAADYDQDRFLDRIVLGEVSLNEAQQIYDYGLDRLTAEKKLRVRVPNVDRYVHQNNSIVIEIRSFRPDNAQPFNEFVITDYRAMTASEVVIIVDRNADGTLDEVLKGSMPLEQAQSQYEEAIKAGLQRGELVKANQTILAKKK